MHAAKVGHFVTPGGSLSGDVSIVPIGIPAGSETEADVWLLDLPGLTPILKPKGALDHKRSVGTVLVVGGSRGMGGAAFLAAMGALRSGAGLVHVALPASAAAGKPFIEVITTTLPDEQSVGPASLAALREEMRRFKAVAIGPGLGREDATAQVVRELVKEPVPLLLDADGLWALGEELALLKGRGAPAVLTPHEGELGRLLGRPAAEVAAHRLACAREAAAASGATVLLKGEASIVADPSGAAYIIPTGNPGLATPGTGDVLSGAIVAQLAKSFVGHRRRLPRRLPAWAGSGHGGGVEVRHRGHDRRRSAGVPAAGRRARQGRPGRSRPRSRARARGLRSSRRRRWCGRRPGRKGVA